jgi:hypothetical protein
MKDISRELLQAFVARQAKIQSVRNPIALLGEIWVQERADGYRLIDPFLSLVLPDPDLPFESQWFILCPIQPTAGKACSLQTTHQIGHFAGGVPDDPRFVIRDHA